jgi:hypothetical protein
VLKLPDFASKASFQITVLVIFIISGILSAISIFILPYTELWLSSYRPWLVAALVSWTVVVLSSEVLSWVFYRPWKEFLEHPTDFRLILSIFWYVCFMATILFQYDVLHAESGNAGPREGFWQARAEFFTVFMAFLAIGGFVYALYAKRVADSVFSKTVVIHKAMTSFFTDFKEVTNEGNERSAFGLIKGAKKSLVLYLGPPLIGYFRKRAFGNLFANTVTTKLNNVDDPLPSGFEIHMICWGEDKCHEYIEASNASLATLNAAEKPKKDPIEETDFVGPRNLLYSEIRRVSADGRGTGEIHFHPRGYDPPLRFVIADGSKAILWILENPTAEGAAAERKKERYAAAGFATDDPYMIRILEGVYKSAAKQAPNEK